LDKATLIGLLAFVGTTLIALVVWIMQASYTESEERGRRLEDLDRRVTILEYGKERGGL